MDAINLKAVIHLLGVDFLDLGAGVVFLGLGV